MLDTVVMAQGNNRLVYYKRCLDKADTYWDCLWAVENIKKYLMMFENGFIGRNKIASILLKYLPKSGTIIEAGCGKGQYVLGLRARGYDCAGYDFAKKTINCVKSLYPALPVFEADVRNLPLPDNSAAAYISLGVMEHFIDGPAEVINESRRILKTKGILIVSIPQVFPWRLREANTSAVETLDDNYSFYQYAFEPEDFRKYLIEGGFEVLHEYGYGVSYAFRIRFKFINKLFSLFPKFFFADYFLDAIPVLSQIARMRFFVAVKK
jgi:SAM-dependent methyltransferase